MVLFLKEDILYTFLVVLIHCIFNTNRMVSGADLPKILPMKDDKKILFASVGETFTLRCPVDTRKDPLTFVDWMKGDESLYLVEGYTVTARGALRIRNVTTADGGTYTCNVINGHGTVAISFTLIINDPRKGNVQKNNQSAQHAEQASAIQGFAPNIRTSQPKIFHEETGGSVAISCSAAGYPAPHIFWLKDGYLVEGPHIDSKRTRSRTQSTIVLRKLEKTDAGKYRCIAKNNVGEDKMDFNLQVIDLFYPPEILSVSPLNSTVICGHAVVFRCNGRNLPGLKLHIKWMKTIRQEEIGRWNRTFQLGSNYYRVLDTDEDPIMANNGAFRSELLISNTTTQDSGTYVCLAVNDKGYKYKNASLKVLAPVQFASRFDISTSSSTFMGVIVFSAAAVFLASLSVPILYCRYRHSQKASSQDVTIEAQTLTHSKIQEIKHLPRSSQRTLVSHPGYI